MCNENNKSREVKEMKEFIKNLFSNRFGIILATLNLCYFLSNSYIYNGYIHNGFEKIMVMTNFPALLLAIVSSKFVGALFQNISTHGGARFSIVLMMFFVTLQWLFIGWLSKTIARKIESRRS